MTPPTVGLRGSTGDEAAPVAEQRPGYWMVRDPFGHVGARPDVLAAYLDPEELAELLALGVRARRGRLLGRIAAKDAVCRWLADRGRAVPAPRAVRVRN